MFVAFSILTQCSNAFIFSLFFDSVNNSGGVVKCEIKDFPYACAGHPTDLYIACASMSLFLLTIYFVLNLYNLVKRNNSTILILTGEIFIVLDPESQHWPVETHRVRVFSAQHWLQRHGPGHILHQQQQREAAAQPPGLQLRPRAASPLPRPPR